MSKTLRFIDDNERQNTLELFLNSEGRLFIQVGDLEDQYNSGYITLDQGDVKGLIAELKRIEKTMKL